MVLTVTTLSCQSPSNKKVKEAEQNLTNSKIALDQAKVNEKDAAKAKYEAEWLAFKNESEKNLNSMEESMKNIQAKIEKAGAKEKVKLEADYAKAKSEFKELKEKLHNKNEEFKEDIKNFDENVIEKGKTLNVNSNTIWMSLEKPLKTCSKTMLNKALIESNKANPQP